MMDTASTSAIVDFEVYVLMTMGPRLKMSRKDTQLRSKLAQHGRPLSDAERLHRGVAAALGDEAARFTTMKKLLGVADTSASSLIYSSAFWPGFEFRATADDRGLLTSAQYWRATREAASADSPDQLGLWSTDIKDFTEHFGPTRRSRQWPVSDDFLPAYEECEFLWNGESYGAGFSWGLLMFASKSWPED